MGRLYDACAEQSSPSTMYASRFLSSFLCLGLSLAGATLDKHVLSRDVDPYTEMHQALQDMQSNYYEVWEGFWPDDIQWTGAFIDTVLSATLNSISSHNQGLTGASQAVAENELNRYYSHVISYYFTEEAFDIQMDAYDDVQWVILGWLEAMRFMHDHNKRLNLGVDWHGTQFGPAFAHRAHVFYEVVYGAYDRKLCGGGITWNPHLDTYKNTITNQLLVSSSVGMYLYHPGDNNTFPFSQPASACTTTNVSAALSPVGAHDSRWRDLAIYNYDWLQAVNLTNAQGLYVDGYHLSDSSTNNPNYGKPAQCDARSEEVFTYNQGVVLSGLRELWEATGNTTYLTDGYKLLNNVIAATGYELASGAVSSEKNYGLGTNGILTENCDPTGDCSQDATTFKGIFFHHLTHFCQALPTQNRLFSGSFLADSQTASTHASNCAQYSKWVSRNAQAALSTVRDGRFGSWWGAPDLDSNDRGRGRTVEAQAGGLAVWRCLYELTTSKEQEV